MQLRGLHEDLQEAPAAEDASVPAHQRAAVQVGARGPAGRRRWAGVRPVCRGGVQVSGVGVSGRDVGRERGRPPMSGSTAVDVFLSLHIVHVRSHAGALQEFHFAFVSLREIVTVFPDDLRG